MLIAVTTLHVARDWLDYVAAFAGIGSFHALRRTYAALRAELGEHPPITAAQMGHRDPRMTLRVYTDVTGMRPRTRLGGLA